jgi:magnesium-transporting ATPase (P-type)
MITGDHALTGLAIGKMLGIAGKETVITGPEIDAMSDETLRGVVNGCNIFARASPGAAPCGGGLGSVCRLASCP